MDDIPATGCGVGIVGPGVGYPTKVAEAGYGPIGGIAEEAATGIAAPPRHDTFEWSELGGLKADVAENGEPPAGGDDAPVGETFMLASLYCR